MTEGTRTIRTTKASSSTADAKPTAIILTSTLVEPTNATKTLPIMSAALVTTRPTPARPT